MKKVLIIIDTSRNAGRELLTGAERYISAFGSWQVRTEHPRYLASEKTYDLRDFDGFFVCDAKNISSVLEADAPKVVNDIQREENPGASSIVTDSKKIGQTAADYFFSLGFRNFAYCGFSGLPWSALRMQSYRQRVLESGKSDIQFFVKDAEDVDEGSREDIAAWLTTLPKPVCVFACNDDRAIYVLDACKAASLHVPEQVAVLGVDNDPLVCNLSSPPLSSMALDFENAGFFGAKQLDALMNRRAKDRTILVEPVEIIERQSTDMLAVKDEEVVQAIVFIRNHYLKPIQAADVVRSTNLSRRTLEYRFAETLNRTIKQEIDRLRLKHIKKRLSNSDDPIRIIAETLAFTDPEHFSRYFKNLSGMSPREFRRSL